MTESTYLHATQVAYDTVAADYAELLRDELVSKPLDRAMLAAFAEVVQASGAKEVAYLGCGPGRITAHLQSLGAPVFENRVSWQQERPQGEPDPQGIQGCERT
ncbi:hypothetical protein [Nonomuraea turcica]|uniref:hypothetical protein n=1 Tax=Nonomuraea sp. G32 TaxID=3067274 RepID=UPI00273C2DA8|nr:hypothetical protein [Nonomuraea sp. G32]MDP4512030.1 hypothetical protein [Nonomuraea sp. G32]